MSILLMAAWLASPSLASRPVLPVVEFVDLPRYMGTWYEVAHMPNFAQKGCTDTIVHYRLNESGGFDLANTCWKDGKYKPYYGKAKRVDARSNAKFRVKFFKIFGGDYLITDLDPDYRWAAVGSPDRDQLWVISRERTLDAVAYEGILSRARALGFDTGRLEITQATGRPSKGFEH